MFFADVNLPQWTTPAAQPRSVGKRKAWLVLVLEEQLVMVAACPALDSEWGGVLGLAIARGRGKLSQGPLTFPA